MFRRLLVTVCGLGLFAGGVSAEEIPYVEDFALAKNRAEALKQLIPGTQDFYYYHCLHYQHTQQFDKAEAILAAWIKRYNYTAQVHEMLNRQVLLQYDKNPARALQRIRERLNLSFNHQREIIGKKPNLPTALDPKRISRESLTSLALSRYRNLQGFEDAALDWLVSTDLNTERRRHLLQRLRRPDHDGLPELIVADLNEKTSTGFGRLPIHQLLLPGQLEALLNMRPQLLNDSAFVAARLAKLHPPTHVDWQHDRKAESAYLDALWNVVSKLGPVHNSLKTNVLYRRLVFDRAGGVYDKNRFLAYIKLPRRVAYINPKFIAIPENSRYAASLAADFRQQTLLPVIGNDEPLVRSYLEHFFLKENLYTEYAPYLLDTYLKHVLAETKIVNGLGDPEQWSALLSPAQFKSLKDRIDLRFAYTNPRVFGPGDAVSVDLAVKNVESLIVKVFEINARNYYRDHLSDVDTDINLDGLVANEERTVAYAEPPLRRVARHFDFPKITKPGVYVIDFIGNGKSSRVLVRKGKLRHLVRTSIAGHVFTVMDGDNKHLKDATVWLAGHEYKPDAEGRITVPFSTSPGRQPIILSHGEFASLDHFLHQAEVYQLIAGVYVDRESLLNRKTAKVLVRPSLSVNGTPVTLGVLEDVSLSLRSIDRDGTVSTKEIKDFKLFEDRESVYEFQVPPRLHQLQVGLQARVPNISGNRKDVLLDAQSVKLNDINRSQGIEDLFLSVSKGSYSVDLLGLTGEPLVDRPVSLKLKHREFTNIVDVQLKTNDFGRVSLGTLDGIDWIEARSPLGALHRWTLPKDRHSYHQVVHAKTGDVIQIPLMVDAQKVDAADVSLLERRGNTYVANRLNTVGVKDGLLQLKGLAAGEYELLLKQSNTVVRLRVGDGELRDGYLLGRSQHLEIRDASPLQIASVAAGEKSVDVKLVNASKFTRVHVLATRYMPAYSVYATMARVRDPEPYLLTTPTVESRYLSGRKIGDEFRYIIDRKYAKKYPGNTLKRPSLILNPWAVRSTSTGTQVAATGDDFKASGAERGGSSSGGGLGKRNAGSLADLSNLDFLQHASSVLLNLTPDKNGDVSVPLEQIGDHQHIHVVAIDPQQTAYRVVSRDEQQTRFEDLRLANGLDAKKHFTQQKRISVVAAKGKFVLDDITSSRFEAYDSLAKVYSLYATLSGDAKLIEFGFVLNWPNLKPEEKLAKYSQYASHELNYFLARKDPKFFQEVIQPYLKNKQHKTFLDHWLLGDDVSRFQRPWEYEQLNTVERILLGQRLKGEATHTSRLISDHVVMLPPNLERFQHLYDTALGSSALDTDDALGLGEATHRALKAAKPNAALQRGFGMGGGMMGGGGMDGRAEAMPGFAGAGPGGFPGRMAKDAPAPPSGAAAPSAGAPRPSSKRESESLAERQESYAKKRLAAPGEDAAGKPQDYFERDKLRRESARRLYEKLDKTQEWAENNYFKVPLSQQNADLVKINTFWNDYAAANPKQPFFSTNLAEAAGNLTEMMFALSVLDLPFKSGEHKSQFNKSKMELAAGSPMIIFHQEIREANAAEDAAPILVSQNFFKHGDRTRIVNGQQVDKYVSDEFLIHAVYGCQVVVTNPSSARQKLNVLVQIPLGAVPVLNAKYTRSVPLDLQPYHTQTIEYHFYFPATGNFPHYPVQVAADEKLIAHASAKTLKVVETPSKIDRGSWDFVSQQGSDEEVLTYLRKQNLLPIKLDRIAFRLKDGKFFKQVIDVLDRRHAYDNTLWSYGVNHNDLATTRQFLKHANGFIAQCGEYLESPLLTIDPVERRSYEHLDYSPIVNARAHRLGGRRQILNDRMFQQYSRLLRILSYRSQLDAEDRMAVTYYMLLQDRVDEALDMFGQVKSQELATQLQHDYFAAYLDLYSDDPKRARTIVDKYADFPVTRWRKAFADVAAQLTEIAPVRVAANPAGGVQIASTSPRDAVTAAKHDELKVPALTDVQLTFVPPGSIGRAIDPPAPPTADGKLVDRNDTQEQLANTEPNFDFKVESKKVGIDYQNLKSVSVNYYEMDIELLFSRNPFVQQFSGEFSYIRPNLTATVKLPEGKKSLQFDLPAQFHSSNVLIEITGAGQTKTQTYYSHSLNIQVVENYGQVRVTHRETRKPLSKTYVKVYAQMGDGQVKFYKDGYTDLRGRFDYTSLNTNELDFVRRFSILILSDEHGAIIREAAPPKR